MTSIELVRPSLISFSTKENVQQKMQILMQNIEEIRKIQHQENPLPALSILKMQGHLMDSHQITLQKISEIFLQSLNPSFTCDWAINPFSSMNPPKGPQISQKDRFNQEIAQKTFTVFNKILEEVPSQILTLVQPTLQEFDFQWFIKSAVLFLNRASIS